MRCFVALDLPEPVRNHLANTTRALRGRYDVKWVGPEHMHATLVFAGDIDGAIADELADAVRSVHLPAMSLRLDQLGHFPPKGVPRVLWAGLAGDVEPLATLHDAIADRAADCGVERDKRGFAPHVTIGRVKSPFGALALIDELRRLGQELKPKPFAPTALALYSSELLPSGPRYEVIVRRPCPVPPTA